MTEPVVSPSSPDPDLLSADADFRLAAADARLLLSYVTETGRPLGDECIRTIVETTHRVAAGTDIKVNDEISFWTAYREVAAAAAPASVASLRASAPVPPGDATARFAAGRASSPAQGTVRWYTAWVIVALVALLVVQIYQLFGATVTREIQSLQKEQEALILRQQEAESRNAQVDRAEFEAARQNLELRKSASYGLLTWWSEKVPDWIGIAPVPTPDKSIKPSDLPLAQRLAVQQRALMIIDALQRYVLPLLYGLLGSCVYVLRTLAEQIRARSYTDSAKIDFRLRLYIGALSGLVVGWFFSSDYSSVMATLQPNALAFLAGYSVDLLFSAMDRVIGAFSATQSNSRSQGPAPR